MRLCAWFVFLCLSLSLASDHPMASQAQPGDPCPLNLRRGIPEVERAREAKKQRMRANGVPERYLHLLDHYECVDCIVTAPDTVHVTIVFTEASAPRTSSGAADITYSVRWTPQIERQLRDDLTAGRVEAFHVWISERRCRCCPEEDGQQPEDEDDWNDDLGVNMDQADSFDDPGDLPPLPDDLKQAPAGWVPPPALEEFHKPRRRVVQVTCDACQSLADRWNLTSGTLDFLWDRKLSLQRQMNQTEHAMGNRRNQINDLEYQQRFAETRSPSGAQEIARLKQFNEDQQSMVDRGARQLGDVERLIAETAARMAAIMTQILACEKACRTTTTATAVTTGEPSFVEVPPTQAAPPPPRDAATPALTPGAACELCNDAAERLKEEAGTLDALRNHLNMKLFEYWLLEAEQQGWITEVRQGVISLSDEQFLKKAQSYSDWEDELSKEVQQDEADVAEQAKRVDAARAALDQCNSTRCGAAPAADPPGGDVTATGTSTLSATSFQVLETTTGCSPCQSLVTRINTARRELQDLTDRLSNIVSNQTLLLNAKLRSLGDQARVRDIDGQLSRLATAMVTTQREIGQKATDLAGLQRQLADCEKQCATGATTANGDINRTGPPGGTGAAPTTTGRGGTGTTGNPPGLNTTGTPVAPAADAPPAMCPDCNAIATAIADLKKQIAEANAAIAELQAAAARNTTNIGNIAQMRYEARADAARVAELEARIKDLENANAANAREQFDERQKIAGFEAEIGRLLRQLETCNSQCIQTGTLNPDTGGIGVTGGAGGAGGAPKRTVAVDPLNATAACKDCEEVAGRLRTAHARLVDLARRANDLQLEEDLTAAEDQRAKVAELVTELARCNATKCKNTTTANADPPAVNTVGNLNTGAPTVNLLDPAAWGDVVRVDIAPGVQRKGVEPSPSDVPQNLQQGPASADGETVILIPSTPPQEVRSWFDPLGLVARRVRDHVERWRGSAGPGPLLRPRDLALVESYSSGQSLGLPRGVHVLLTDRGGSTGRTLAMQVVNLSGKPVRLMARPFAVEPIRQQAQKQIQQAFSRLAKAAPINLDLNAYCLEFLKAPPLANQILRLAPPAVQKGFEPFSKVLRAATRLQQDGLLNPDSQPAAYADAIKQWAVWTVEQKFDESRFAAAFLEHTRKNVVSAGQSWPRDGDAMIRKVSPNRWRDIVRVLSGAGLPVPQ